jgi:hypothetical protein
MAGTGDEARSTVCLTAIASRRVSGHGEGAEQTLHMAARTAALEPSPPQSEAVALTIAVALRAVTGAVGGRLNDNELPNPRSRKPGVGVAHGWRAWIRPRPRRRAPTPSDPFERRRNLARFRLCRCRDKPSPPAHCIVAMRSNAGPRRLRGAAFTGRLKSRPEKATRWEGCFMYRRAGVQSSFNGGPQDAVCRAYCLRRRGALPSWKGQQEIPSR